MHIANNQVISRMSKIGMVMALLLNLAALGSANPPSEIQLSYDKKAKSLHVVVKHISTNMRKHYIRKVEVQINNDPPVPHYLTSQTSASESTVDISLKVAPRDIIHVEAVCSEAGRIQQDLAIPGE